MALLSEGDELWLRFVAGDSKSVMAGMGFEIEITAIGKSANCINELFKCV